jgi:hypothetical protein
VEKRADLDVNCKDGRGWAALLWAAEKGQEAVVQLLLEKRADILGMNWLKHHGVTWDLVESRLSLDDGSKRHCYLQIRPHQILDPTSALPELDLNALSYKEAQKAIRDRPESTRLYLLKGKKQKRDHSELPQFIDPRYEPVVRRYRGLFRDH